MFVETICISKRVEFDPELRTCVIVTCVHLIQAPEWIDAALQQEKSSVQKRRILLEEAQGWKNYKRRSHEAQGARCGMHLRLLRALGHHAHLPQKVLLAPAGEHCVVFVWHHPGCLVTGLWASVLCIVLIHKDF